MAVRGSKSEDYGSKPKKRPAPKEKAHIGKIRMTSVTPDGFVGSSIKPVQRVNSVSDKKSVSDSENLRIHQRDIAEPWNMRIHQEMLNKRAPKRRYSGGH